MSRIIYIYLIYWLLSPLGFWGPKFRCPCEWLGHEPIADSLWWQQILRPCYMWIDSSNRRSTHVGRSQGRRFGRSVDGDCLVGFHISNPNKMLYLGNLIIESLSWTYDVEIYMCWRLPKYSLDWFKGKSPETQMRYAFGHPGSLPHQQILDWWMFIQPKYAMAL